MTSVVLEEIPDRVSLAVDISNCRGNCVGCHSPFLKKNIGRELTPEVIDRLVADNFGVNCFLFLGEGRDPEELLGWLEDHRPSFEPVLSHGDFCLPNIFLHDGGISGFIDLGDAGIGDKWRDVALCCRSLKHNFDGSYGGKVYPDFDPNLLFDALGIEPDREKMRYYTLLDELF